METVIKKRRKRGPRFKYHYSSAMADYEVELVDMFEHPPLLSYFAFIIPIFSYPHSDEITNAIIHSNQIPYLSTPPLSLCSFLLLQTWNLFLWISLPLFYLPIPRGLFAPTSFLVSLFPTF
ncbi:hypothetical protein Csa_022339 [Cucumis sativus]|uniref:Uncharacterized protein n=1 Tax=Cucumis sativus TaxID=3659 RepID=A0A0A0LPM1_CUCSA|nr:hypothetical protein Csa_022339 [Cucumis sativus]